VRAEVSAKIGAKAPLLLRSPTQDDLYGNQPNEEDGHRIGAKPVAEEKMIAADVKEGLASAFFQNTDPRL
jgi:hypothetical protein